VFFFVVFIFFGRRLRALFWSSDPRRLVMFHMLNNQKVISIVFIHGIHEMGTYDQGYESHLRFVPPSSEGHAYRYLDIYYCDGIVNCTIE